MEIKFRKKKLILWSPESKKCPKIHWSVRACVSTLISATVSGRATKFVTQARYRTVGVHQAFDSNRKTECIPLLLSIFVCFHILSKSVLTNFFFKSMFLSSIICSLTEIFTFYSDWSLEGEVDQAWCKKDSDIFFQNWSAY